MRGQDVLLHQHQLQVRMVKVKSFDVVAVIIYFFAVFLLSGQIRFGKMQSGCRYSLYQLAEESHGKVRNGLTSDGIYYDAGSPHLKFQLLFSGEHQAEDFESRVYNIPGNYRKKANAESDTDISVELGAIMRILISPDIKLVRVMAVQYEKLEDGENASPDFDVFSNSNTSVVEITAETKLRLVEKEDSKSLFRQKPEKCHFISQSKYKEDKYNPNNIIFMSRNLHQQFDAIDSSEGIPMFYLEYVSHDPTPIQGLVNGLPYPVYPTQVNAVFKDEVAKSVLSVDFKKHTVISSTVIQFILHFPSPVGDGTALGFREYAQRNAFATILKWRSYDGVVEA
mmetsp:Transcript_9047/g.12527  ORF Transcript_9047/g.12527 Transcript_9047/m.12527 type:complete len:339 (-) Transcript_9047:188-1204(-)